MKRLPTASIARELVAEAWGGFFPLQATRTEKEETALALLFLFE